MAARCCSNPVQRRLRDEVEPWHESTQDRIVFALRRFVHRSARGLQIALRTAPFWLRSPLYRWTPGGFGYYRTLRRYADPSYVHERDKHPVRRRHFGAERLREPDEDRIVRRDYSSYDEYIAHQRQKLDELLRLGGAFPNKVVADSRLRFYRRFRYLIRLLPRDATIICVGARQGTEVEVLRELGFPNAYGIDLNPGPENTLVRVGDFNDLDEDDASVDVVYSNSLDHALDLGVFFREQARVLKPAGYALYDIQRAHRLGEKAAFEATLWLRQKDIVVRALQHFERILLLQAEAGWTWMLLQGPRDAGTAARAAEVSPSLEARVGRGTDQAGRVRSA